MLSLIVGRRQLLFDPNHPEFEFHAGDVTLEQAKFKKRKLKGVLESLNSKEQVNMPEV